MSRSPIAPFIRWPSRTAATYRKLGYWQHEYLDGFLLDRARRFADHTAVAGARARDRRSWHRLTYAQLDAAVDTAAQRFLDAGIERRDRVIVQLPNVIEFVETIFGLFRIGAIPVFALPAHRSHEITAFCATADAAGLVIADGWGDHAATAAEATGWLREKGISPPVVIDLAHMPWPKERRQRAAHPHMAWPDPTDLALLQLSGGTTGVPKLIPRTHADYLYSVRESANICRVTAETSLLVSLPAAHNFPMSSPGILGVFDRGGTVVLAPDPSPATAFRLIENEQVTMASLVPPLLTAWLAAADRKRDKLASLEVVQVGGARLADSVATQVRSKLGVQLQQVFGMAEGLVNYTRLDDPNELVTTTQGRPISPHDEIRVVDENDHDVPDGQVGHLLTRGPYTIRGYYPESPHDLQAFTADGFYRTGDLVRRLPSGHFQVTGRTKDQINRGGEKIAIDEIESILAQHPGIYDAVLIGLPDQHLGERPCAVLVQTEGAEHPLDAATVRAWLTERGLAGFKLPDRVEVVDQFPTTGVGKTSRGALREALAKRLISD